MQPRLSLFLQGIKTTIPYQGAALPFGVLYSTLALDAGLSPFITMMMCVLVFGGSSQLVFIDLFQQTAAPFQAVLGSNIVNARHLIYSAGVSRTFSTFSLRWRLILGYLLTDLLYGVSQSETAQSLDSQSPHLPWFYFGAGLCTWISWQCSALLGIGFGHFVPKTWNLGFAIPLMFMPLVFTVSKTRIHHLTCLIAAALVVVTKPLPFGLGVVISILGAGILGTVMNRRGKGVGPI